MGYGEIPPPAGAARQETVKSGFSPETAHLPGFSHLSYVVTGDYFFLEESYFWAGYVVFSANPGYSKGTIYSGQLRGCAWGLRSVALTAGIAPDDDPEKESFSKRVRYTLRNHIEERAEACEMCQESLGCCCHSGRRSHGWHQPSGHSQHSAMVGLQGFSFR